MDRDRLIDELTQKGLEADGERLDVVETLGRGGNGVAFLCAGETSGDVVAKVYMPPDKRDLDDQSVGRFKNEVKLASVIRHPHVIPALSAGQVTLGAYVLPFYVMPHAASTLRAVIGGPPQDGTSVDRVARLFLQACMGVSCLHANGVVHRDLKPENVLISRDGNAWVADLGIAHIDPDFVSVSLRTIAAERLLNRDYYAPEQRFGTVGEVDGRADIYALGCILYELFTGAPPVRRDSPPVASVDLAFAPLDAVINRMTAYEPTARYQHVEDAITDAALALGWTAATMAGAARPAPKDLKEMSRLLRSANGVNRTLGVELASKLGVEALPALHDLTGHGRREVRNAAAAALAEIGDLQSVPYLVAGLYGNSQKASTFRPTIDVAAELLRGFSPGTRLDLLGQLEQPVRPAQIVELLGDIDSEVAFRVVNDLHSKGLILLDWAESHLDILVALDEERAWPLVWAESETFSGWNLSRMIVQVAPGHQVQLAERWIAAPRGDAWNWDRMVPAIVNIPVDREDLRPLLERLEKRLDEYPGQGRHEAAHRSLLRRLLG